MIEHRGRRFVADVTGVGTVVRTTEYPDFVYHHPDGRTARHPIGAAASRTDAAGRPVGKERMVLIDARGVLIYNHFGWSHLYPWQ